MVLSMRLPLRRYSSQLSNRLLHQRPTLTARYLHLPPLRLSLSSKSIQTPQRFIVPSSPSRPFSVSTHSRQNNVGITAPPCETEPPKPEAPAYDLTFTCKKCDNRSTHKVSKQGYHNGTVLITCPGCKNRHLIADHLKIFSDKRITLEDIMKEKGQVFRKGGLLPSGDVEFWDTGEVVTREPPGVSARDDSKP